MATNEHHESSTDLPLPEQEVVDTAYERLDAPPSPPASPGRVLMHLMALDAF